MLTCLFLIFSFQATPTQTTSPTPDRDRLDAYDTRLERESQSPFEALEMRSIGPMVMGARVVDLLGFADKPHTYLVAYASGGLWRTTNQGTTWTPLFDDMPTITIGDIAVDPNDANRIWVGTGEDNSSRSSYAGTGIYLTEDGGKTWSHKGLLDTHHISKVLVHPTNPDVVYVAVIGRLYTDNPERGVYKTSDGGKTWSKVLYVNEKTGVIDLVMDPKNPDRLIAAAWQRYRKAWDFSEGGPGSGLYLTKNGGTSWEKAGNGLPQGENIGRIGLSICLSQPNTIYATLDNQNELENPEPDNRAVTLRKLADMDKETFLDQSDRDIRGFLRRNAFHRDITVEKLREQLKSDEITIQDLIDYVYDGNASLFDRQIHGAQVYRSDDGGETWRKTHDEPIPSFVYSYGYYFGIIEVDPNDPDTIYITGVPILKSSDGGKTFKNTAQPGVHVDHHALWIDPNNSKHVVLGNDGGVYMSWDEGENWLTFNYMPVGQFYTVAYDMAQPYNIYGGLQDNGVWYGPSREQRRYSQPWTRIMGGDGAFVQVDPTDNATVYAGYQFGHYARQNLNQGGYLPIFPRHQLKEQPYRFNWMTPFVLSKHKNDILYMGGNRVLRSMNKGEDWEAISPDLTTNPKQEGDVVFGTITSLRESQKTFGTLYVGTDDGKLWVSRGNYDDWKDISQGVEQGLWVSSIETSPHKKGEVFVTLTGYRNDDFRAYLYQSKDYGETWESIKGDLPDEACNVIRQDIENPDMLYLGTDVGLWVSFDRGQHWLPYQHGLPKVPVYALEVHPREHELIVATHGRSIFVLECQTLAQLTPDKMDESLVLLEQEEDSTSFNYGWGDNPRDWSTWPSRTPHTELWFYTKGGGEVTFLVQHDDKVVHQSTKTVQAGLNSVEWDYEVQPEPVKKGKKAKKKKKDGKKAEEYHKGENGKSYAVAGKYTFKISLGEADGESKFTIKPPRSR